MDADMEKFLLSFCRQVLLSSNTEKRDMGCLLLSKGLNKCNQTDV